MQRQGIFRKHLVIGNSLRHVALAHPLMVTGLMAYTGYHLLHTSRTSGQENLRIIQLQAVTKPLSERESAGIIIKTRLAELEANLSELSLEEVNTRYRDLLAVGCKYNCKETQILFVSFTRNGCPDETDWQLVLGYCCRRGEYHEALEVFAKMRSGGHTLDRDGWQWVCEAWHSLGDRGVQRCVQTLAVIEHEQEVVWTPIVRMLYVCDLQDVILKYSDSIVRFGFAKRCQETLALVLKCVIRKKDAGVVSSMVNIISENNIHLDASVLSQMRTTFGESSSVYQNLRPTLEILCRHSQSGFTSSDAHRVQLRSQLALLDAQVAFHADSGREDREALDTQAPLKAYNELLWRAFWHCADSFVDVFASFYSYGNMTAEAWSIAALWCFAHRWDTPNLNRWLELLCSKPGGPSIPEGRHVFIGDKLRSIAPNLLQEKSPAKRARILGRVLKNRMSRGSRGDEVARYIQRKAHSLVAKTFHRHNGSPDTAFYNMLLQACNHTGTEQLFIDLLRRAKELDIPISTKLYAAARETFLQDPTKSRSGSARKRDWQTMKPFLPSLEDRPQLCELRSALRSTMSQLPKDSKKDSETLSPVPAKDSEGLSPDRPTTKRSTPAISVHKVMPTDTKPHQRLDPVEPPNFALNSYREAIRLHIRQKQDRALPDDWLDAESINAPT